MKAQISFVEFLTSAIIFIAFVAYFSLQVLMFVPAYINEIKAERLRSEAFQVSELLINDPGDPPNWNEFDLSNVRRIGLSDHAYNKTNLLSSAKISTFNSSCQNQQNYTKFKKLIGLDNDFSWILISSTGELFYCRPIVTMLRPVNVTIRRIIAYDGGKYGEMILQVW